MATVTFRMRSTHPMVPAIRNSWETICVDVYRSPLWDSSGVCNPAVLTYGDAMTAAMVGRQYQVALAEPPSARPSAATVYMRATTKTQQKTSMWKQPPPPSACDALRESPTSLEASAASASRHAMCNRRIAACLARTRPPNTLDRTGGAVVGLLSGLRGPSGSPLGEEAPITTRYNSVDAYFEVGIPIPEYTAVWYFGINCTAPSRPWPLDWRDDWGI